MKKTIFVLVTVTTLCFPTILKADLLSIFDAESVSFQESPLVVVVDDDGEPTKVLSIDGSCSTGKVADPVNYTCKNKNNKVYWATTSVDIRSITDANGDLENCKWKANKRLYQCKIKSSLSVGHEIKYIVTLENGRVLDPTIILH